ncbi:uncharacterized protein [Ptychodera flava]|uniref:uncharacterized protein isoform X2 n=1 Tax=Ptychodera flava TaxID=63121 RepID=UPI003969FD00
MRTEPGTHECHEEQDELPVATDDTAEESYRTTTSDNEPYGIMTEITTEDTVGPINDDDNDDDDDDDGDDGTCDDDLSPPGTLTAPSTVNARTPDATQLSSVLPENKRQDTVSKTSKTVEYLQSILGNITEVEHFTKCRNKVDTCND